MKINQKGFSATVILLVILVLAVVGFAGWYVYQSQHKTNNTVSNIGGDQSSNITQKDTKTSDSTVKPTATPVTQTTTKNELDTLREFCQGADPDTVVSGIVYIENHDGKFATCGITDAEGMGGAMLLSTYLNGKWTKMWAGNGIMDASLCTQYKIPIKIYADCSGNYQ